MKIKGTNAFEQHCEKILLMLVLVAFLGVLALQFVGKPNHVDVGGEQVPPQQVFQELATQASNLNGRLVDVDPGLPEVSSVDLLASYRAQLTSPIAPSDRLAMSFGVPEQAGGVLGDDQTDDTLISQTGPIAGLQMPALSASYVNAQWVTIDPYVLQQIPLLSRYVSQRQPHDFASVSVQGVISREDVMGALTSAPEGQRAIPRKFWNSTGLVVMSVESQRQRLNSDGTWEDDGAPVPMPGTLQATWYLDGDEELSEFQTLIAGSGQAAERVARPPFPATISGPTWLPPRRAQERTASYANLGEIKRLEARIAQLQEDIERISTGGTQRQTSSPAGNTGRGGRTTRPTTPTRDPGTGTSQRDREIARKQIQIEQAQEELDSLRFQGGQTDASDPAAPGTRGGAPLFRARSGSGAGSVLDAEETPVWTHDIGVQPGATYRYRLRVGVNNPLYGRGADLDPENDEHQSLARQPLSYTPWTDWSDPVVVGAREYFFVTNARLGGQLGVSSPSATGELYTMHYGYYRRASVTLNPGDPVTTSTRVPEGLVTFNTASIEREAAAEALAAYQKSLGREDTPNMQGPGGRFPPPGGRDPFPTTPRGTDPVTSPTDPGAAFELPAGMASLEGRLPIELSMILLDVSDWPVVETNELGQERISTRVYLREADGRVRAVVPGEMGAAYDVVSLSNTLSEDAWVEFQGQDGSAPATGGPVRPLFNPAELPNPFGPVPDGIWGP